LDRINNTINKRKVDNNINNNNNNNNNKFKSKIKLIDFSKYKPMNDLLKKMNINKHKKKDI